MDAVPDARSSSWMARLLIRKKPQEYRDPVRMPMLSEDHKLKVGFRTLELHWQHSGPRWAGMASLPRTQRG